MIIKKLNTKIDNQKVTHFSHDFPFSMLPEPVNLKLNVREFKCILIAYLITCFFYKKVNFFSENVKKKKHEFLMICMDFEGHFLK